MNVSITVADFMEQPWRIQNLNRLTIKASDISVLRFTEQAKRCMQEWHIEQLTFINVEFTKNFCDALRKYLPPTLTSLSLEGVKIPVDVSYICRRATNLVCLNIRGLKYHPLLSLSALRLPSLRKVSFDAYTVKQLKPFFQSHPLIEEVTLRNVPDGLWAIEGSNVTKLRMYHCESKTECLGVFNITSLEMDWQDFSFIPILPSVRELVFTSHSYFAFLEGWVLQRMAEWMTTSLRLHTLEFEAVNSSVIHLKAFLRAVIGKTHVVNLLLPFASGSAKDVELINRWMENYFSERTEQVLALLCGLSSLPYCTRDIIYTLASFLPPSYGRTLSLDVV
jgi:hypothetical protein